MALDNLPAGAFRKDDPAPDTQFYTMPRFVTHIDDAAIAAVTEAYRKVLPAGGAILDLMSSWSATCRRKWSTAGSSATA